MYTIRPGNKKRAGLLNRPAPKWDTAGGAQDKEGMDQGRSERLPPHTGEIRGGPVDRVTGLSH